MKKGILSVVALAVALASCNKETSTTKIDTTDITQLSVPSGFNWSSAKAMTADISVTGFDGNRMSNVRIDLFDKDPYDGGEIFYSGFTNAQGELNVPVKIKTSLKEVIVVANAVGIGGNRIVCNTTGGTLKAHFSGIPQARKFDKFSEANFPATQASSFPNDNVFYLGNHNGWGVPTSTIANITPGTGAMIANINALLVESNHIPCSPVHAPLLNDVFCNSVTTSKDDAEVFVTFLGEGASYHNALAYYYHPAGAAPATNAAIDSIFIIFPDASEAGNKLAVGDRVKLGEFPKNTTIQWVLLGNMWNESADSVALNPANTSHHIFHGDDPLNADMGIDEAACLDPTFQQHMISMSQDLDGENVQIFAFEDIVYPDGDYDFNDCIFYASGDIYESCAPALPLQVGQSVIDSDKDGVIDAYDDEPNNPDVVCVITDRGTLLYEDLWPEVGDYDFNDMVTGYVFETAINNLGEVHEVRMDYKLKAAGAGYNNGFGVMFDDLMTTADIAAISARTSNGTHTQEVNGLATTPGSDVVMYNWDAANDLIVKDLNAGLFFNTIAGGGKGTPVTENIVVSMNAGVDPWKLGLPPYNPFIMKDGQQMIEIHLADMAPSSVQDMLLFGTMDDGTTGVAGDSYTTGGKSNLPWGLDIPAGAFEWANEYTPITVAYPQFAAWASSGGMVNTNWYNFPAAGQTYTP